MIRTFRGNCEQVRIQEAQVIASGRVMKVGSGDSTPIFPGQEKAPSLVHFREYFIRTDSGKKFIPDAYRIKYVYNETSNYAEVHMDRQVIDCLLNLITYEQLGQLEEIKNSK